VAVVVVQSADDAENDAVLEFTCRPMSDPTYSSRGDAQPW
jgi:hypothetical protein